MIELRSRLLLLGVAWFGIPFHFELTFGTSRGSVLSDSPTALAPFNAPCIFCSLTYWSHAEVDGSFVPKKALTADLLFFCSWKLGAGDNIESLPLNES